MSVDASTCPPVASPSINDENETKNLAVSYDVADVVWVKLGGHPWWPSLIIRDPNDSSQSFTKIIGTTRAKRMYFVVFYGSTADFAWVADSSIIPYRGVSSFAEFAQQIVDKAPNKSQKEQLTERFQLKITMSRRDDWQLAVKEADQAVSQSSDKRLEQIEPKIEFYTAKLGKISHVDESSNSIHDETNSFNGKKRGRPARLVKEQNEQIRSDSPWKKFLLAHRRQPSENRIGFLTPFEDQQIVQVLEHLRSNQTLADAEKLARQRYTEILSINLNRTDIQIPDEWFYSFLFAHPILLVKNEHWFNDKSSSDLLTNVNASTNVDTLKQQLAILGKFYQNQLEICPTEN